MAVVYSGHTHLTFGHYPVALADVCSKVVVLFLLFNWLL